MLVQLNVLLAVLMLDEAQGLQVVPSADCEQSTFAPVGKSSKTDLEAPNSCDPITLDEKVGALETLRYACPDGALPMAIETGEVPMLAMSRDELDDAPEKLKVPARFGLNRKRRLVSPAEIVADLTTQPEVQSS